MVDYLGFKAFCLGVPPFVGRRSLVHGLNHAGTY